MKFPPLVILKNVDLVVTFGICAAVLILSFAGVIAQTILLQAVLAVCTLLSIALLRITLANTKLAETSTKLTDQIAALNLSAEYVTDKILRREYPDLSQVFLNSERILLIG